MRLRSILVTVLFFLFFFSFCRASYADGSYIPDRPYAKLPDIPTQRALLKYRNGVETLIIESPFEGEGEQFAWIIPIPSKPHRLESITPGLLKTISFTLQPKVTHRFPYENSSSTERFYFYLFVISWMFCMALSCLYIVRKKPTIGSIIAFDLVLVPIVFFANIVLTNLLFAFAAYRGGPSLPTATSVTVESWQFIGDYEVSVLTADNSGDLNTWLANNGYRKLPEKALPIVDDYIDDKWVFVAAKITREGDGTSAPHPILIEFDTEKPVYPMRLTALSGSPLNLELFTLASQEAVPVNYDLKKRYCDYFDHQEPPDSHGGFTEAIPRYTKLYAARSRGPRELRYAHTIGHPTAMELMWDGSVMTKLTGKISSDEMKSDMFFWFKEATPFVWHVYSTGWAFRTGIVLAIVVGLFGLQGMSLWYGRNREFPPMGLFPLIILGTVVFSATYFGLGTVEVNELISNNDWRYYLSALEVNARDLSEAAAESPQVEITDYLSKYYKNPASNKQAIIEDSPGNITVVRKEITTSLIAYLWDGTPIILHEFVGYIPGPRQVEVLVEVATTDQSALVRESAVARLMNLSDPRGAELLVDALQDNDPSIRENSARALHEIGDSRAIIPLTAALNDPNSRVRKSAESTLKWIEYRRRYFESKFAELKGEDQRVQSFAGRTLVRSKDPRALEVLIAASKDENPETRALATGLLRKSKDPRAVEALILALQDESSRVRVRATITLGYHRGTRAAYGLTTAANDSNRRVRWWAINGLKKMRPQLVAALNDVDPSIRENAVKALGKIGDREAIKSLRAALNDPDDEVQQSAASALQEIERKLSYFETQIAQLKGADYRVINKTERALIREKDPLALEALIAALQDEDPSVRVRAAGLLSRKGDLRGLKTLLAELKNENSEIRSLAVRRLRQKDDSRVVEALITALQDKSQRVRISAAGTLRYHRDPRVVCALIEAVNDSDVGVRWSAIHGLKKMDTEIAAALKDKNSCVHESALKTLPKTDKPRTAAELIAALQDKHQLAKARTSMALRKQRLYAPTHRIVPPEQRNNRVRDRTPKTLPKTDKPRTVEELIAALQDKNEIVRAEAADALGKMREPRAFEALTEALGDENYRVQGSAWRALNRIEDPRVVEALVAALQHKNPRIRLGAAYALSERKNPRGLENLLVLVKDEDPRVRGETLTALRQIKDPRAVEALIAALHDESAPVRVRAAIGLGHQVDSRALHPLIAALDDSEPGVRMWAGRALQRMASELVAELDAKDPAVRRTAARALREITHKDLGEDSAEWQEWWEQNKKTATEGG